MSKFSVAVIGVGFIGVKHVEAYSTCPSTEVVAVCDVDKAKLKAFRKRFRRFEMFTDYVEMMEHVNPEVISICSPVQTHAQIVYDLVKFKPKAIFCEKPLAHNLDACKEVVKVCRENNVVLAVDFTRRWDEAYREAQRFISREEFGLIRVVGYASRERDWLGNIHMFDVLNWFSGGNWNLCSYVDCYPTDYLIFEVDVLGKNERLRIVDNGEKFLLYTSVESDKGGHYGKVLKEVGLLSTPSYNFSKALLNAVEDLTVCIKTGKKPECDGENALKTHMFYEEWRKRNGERGCL